MSIKCEFVNCRPLFILAVYLPSANHALEEFKECFDYLWALYDSLSADSFVILLGDFNGYLGNYLGDKVKRGTMIVVCYYLILLIFSASAL